MSSQWKLFRVSVYEGRVSKYRQKGAESEIGNCLILVEFFIYKLVLALLLERDDDKCHEDVDEEERKDDEVDDVEDGHVHPVAGSWTAVLTRRIYRVLQHTTHDNTTLFYQHHGC